MSSSGNYGSKTNQKKTFKDAIRSGKIRDTTTFPVGQHSNMAKTKGRLAPDFDLFDPSHWTRFMKDCDQSEWKDFEEKERLFRQAIATKPIHIKKTFHHQNPVHWKSLTNLLNDLFWKDGNFIHSKPNGTPYSLNFVKYVIRVLRHYPVDWPEECDTDSDADNNYDSILRQIRYALIYISEHISPMFCTRRPTRRMRRTEDEPIVSKGELTQLWHERQKEAVEIINNGSRKLQPERCTIDRDNVHQHFQTRCQRIVRETPSPPWRDEINIHPPEWTPPPFTFTARSLIS